ncbi:MAG: hypothetical protein Q8S43_04635 [Actinomycetota bacterium]|nr:MAG: hypothetical protein FD171_1294 [Actinomycetota bacterium]MDO8949820.1 hypothetical protein [Actinomycetota bacterium]MDP3630225.1 hypothetical protein [Actinomycetota bacterium]
MPIVGDPQGTQARATASEPVHPKSAQDETPAGYGWKQLLAVGLVVGVPILLYLIVTWIR